MCTESFQHIALNDYAPHYQWNMDTIISSNAVHTLREMSPESLTSYDIVVMRWHEDIPHALSFEQDIKKLQAQTQTKLLVVADHPQFESPALHKDFAILSGSPVLPPMYPYALHHILGLPSRIPRARRLQSRQAQPLPTRGEAAKSHRLILVLEDHVINQKVIKQQQ